MEQGNLKIRLETANSALPVVGRVIVSQSEGGVRVFEEELLTDAEGVTESITLTTPNRSISLDPNSLETPYSSYDVEAYADGFAPVIVEGVQIYSGVESELPIAMIPTFSVSEASASDSSSQQTVRYTIPDPAIRTQSSSGPTPLVVCENSGRVLSSVFIPSKITVHLGRPQSSAANETVSFPYYIKNVCCSEIYPTWPENAIRANIYAQISLALNRIYTEWYPSKGYSFNITNSTQYDQYYVSGRNLFTNISRIVDEIFNTYLRRVGDFAPYYAEYCNGTTATCRGLSQWGTVSLANSGRTPIQILRYYYGSNFELVTTNDIRSIPSSYQGTALRLGSSGDQVRIIQRWLARIARNYPAIGNITVDGQYGPATEAAVRQFQRIFNLTVDGVVGKRTWYQISYIYVAVKKLAELGSEIEPYPDGNNRPSQSDSLRVGSTGANVAAVQYRLAYLSQTFYPSIPEVVPDGVFGSQTRAAVVAFQSLAGLTQDGVVGPATWNALEDRFEDAYEDNNPNSYFGAYPGVVLRQGNSGLRVQQMQYYLLYLSYYYSSIPRIRADGEFGSQTRAAVVAFQNLTGLTPDGVVGINTWTQLFNLYSQRNANLIAAEELPAFGGSTLRCGSEGTAVLVIQRYLSELSRKNPAIGAVELSGTFTRSTDRAVRAFQEQNNLTITGRVNEETWNAIYQAYLEFLLEQDGECRIIDIPYPGEPVQTDQAGIYLDTAVYYYRVISLFDPLLPPVLEDDEDDLYPFSVREAIIEFQRTRGLSVTGEIDEDTWLMLYYQYLAAYEVAYPECREIVAEDLPVQVLGAGSRGANVEQLQEWINFLAEYYCELIYQIPDGEFDDRTASNVLLLQEFFRLTPTGRVDNETWEAIKSAYHSLRSSNNTNPEAAGDLLDVSYSRRTLSMTERVRCTGNCQEDLFEGEFVENDTCLDG